VALIGLLIYDWANIDDEEKEGERVLIRAAVTAVALMLMGRSFLGSLLLGALWGFVGGVILSMIRDQRNPVTSSASAGRTQAVPQVREYVVGGNGQVTNKIFNARDYPECIEVERTREGRTLVDSMGKIVCTRYVYPAGYTGAKSVSQTKAVPQVREYVVSGDGRVTNKIYSSRDYPGYTEVERNGQGRILSDSTGKIVCTRYIKK
jgi:hypothetical protein